MATPFDPKPMPGADKRALELDQVATAIAQAKTLSAYAQLQALSIDMQRLSIQPIMPGHQQQSEALARQHYDLQSLQAILQNYLNGLIGWQTGERQQDQPNTFSDVPVEVQRYVQSIKDNAPYVLPTHTG